MLVSDGLNSIASSIEKEGHLPPSVEMTVLKQEKRRAVEEKRRRLLLDEEREMTMALMVGSRRSFLSASPGPSFSGGGEGDSSVGYCTAESSAAGAAASCCHLCSRKSTSTSPQQTPFNSAARQRAGSVPLLLRVSSLATTLSSSPSPLRSGLPACCSNKQKQQRNIRETFESRSASSDSCPIMNQRNSSPLKWKQFTAKAVDDRQSRLLKLTKRHCLSSASCVLLRSWTSMNPYGQHSELRSTPAQLQESLEKFVLKLLAAAGVVTPYAFSCALLYLQRLSWSAGMNIHPQSLHMATLAAVLIACKCNGEDKSYKNLVAQFAKLCLCTTAELAAAERVLFQLLLDSDISLMPTTAELSGFMKDTLLPQSIPCSHDITSGRHCWVGLFPHSIQPYPVGATNQEPISLSDMCKMMPSTRGSTSRVSALFAPFAGEEAAAATAENEKRCKLANPSPASIVKKSNAQKKSQNLSGFDEEEVEAEDEGRKIVDAGEEMENPASPLSLF